MSQTACPVVPYLHTLKSILGLDGHNKTTVIVKYIFIMTALNMSEI